MRVLFYQAHKIETGKDGDIKRLYALCICHGSHGAKRSQIGRFLLPASVVKTSWGMLIDIGRNGVCCDFGLLCRIQ